MAPENEGQEPEVETIATIPSEEGISSDGISDVLEQALKGNTDTPEDTGKTEEDVEEGQAEEVETVLDSESDEVEPDEEDEIQNDPKKPFADIVLEGKKLLTLKTQDDFNKFLEMNPLLKKGVMLQSDYTRKTMQVADARKQHEQQVLEFEKLKNAETEAWGGNPPDDSSKTALQNLWQVFQYASDPLAAKIQHFLNDVSLISEGKPPVGPLLGQNGQQHDFSNDLQTVGLRREFDRKTRELDRKLQEFQTRETAKTQEQANQEVQGWMSKMEESGRPVTTKERNAMAQFSNVKDSQGRRISLDKMYSLALHWLGKSEKESIQKIHAISKKRSNENPSKPRSPVSAGTHSKAETLDDVLRQGAEEIAA